MIDYTKYKWLDVQASLPESAQIKEKEAKRLRKILHQQKKIFYLDIILISVKNMLRKIALIKLNLIPI